MDAGGFTQKLSFSDDMASDVLFISIGECPINNLSPKRLMSAFARVLVECVDCRKPRVVHSTTRLSERQKLGLAIVFSEYEYSCGSEVVPPEHSLHDKVFVRTTLTCESRIESSYYSSDIGRKDTCCFCACPEAEVDGDLKKQYKTVLPVCVACRATGHEVPCMRPYGKK